MVPGVTGNAGGSLCSAAVDIEHRFASAVSPLVLVLSPNHTMDRRGGRVQGTAGSRAVAASLLVSAEMMGSASISEVLAHAVLPDGVGSTRGAPGMAAFGEPVTPFGFFFPAATDAVVTIPRLDFVPAECQHQQWTLKPGGWGRRGGSSIINDDDIYRRANHRSVVCRRFGAVDAEVTGVAAGAVAVLVARSVFAADTVDWLHGAEAGKRGDDMMAEPRGHELKVNLLA